MNVSTSKPERTPNMSSRLLNMKFMQRGPGSPSLPTSPQSTTKRQRVASPPSVSQKLEQTARSRTHNSEDSEWYLNTQLSQPSKPCAPVTFISAGLGALDSPVCNSLSERSNTESEEDAGPREQTSLNGRRSFGAFKRRFDENSVAQVKCDSNVSELDEKDTGGLEDETVDSGRSTGRGNFPKRKYESKQSRRKKEVDLNKITSISGYRNRSGLGRPKA